MCVKQTVVISLSKTKSTPSWEGQSLDTRYNVYVDSAQRRCFLKGWSTDRLQLQLQLQSSSQQVCSLPVKHKCLKHSHFLLQLSSFQTVAPSVVSSCNSTSLSLAGGQVLHQRLCDRTGLFNRKNKKTTWMSLQLMSVTFL